VLLVPKLIIQPDSDVRSRVEQAREGGAKRILIVDPDAREAGAPQHVQIVSDLVAGGHEDLILDASIRLIHVAELALGLGVAQVVVWVKDIPTELALRNFYTKFGRAILYAGTVTELEAVRDLDSQTLVYAATPGDIGLCRPERVLADPDPDFRNPELWSDVGLFGLIVEEGRNSNDLCRG
jgi:hypothetical protein